MYTCLPIQVCSTDLMEVGPLTWTLQCAMFMYIYIYDISYIYTGTPTHTHAYIYIYTHTHTHIYIYICIERERDRDTHIHAKITKPGVLGGHLHWEEELVGPVLTPSTEHEMAEMLHQFQGIR